MSKETEIAALIPQVFFDIIARVIPGVVLLSLYILVYLGFDEYWRMFKEWLGPSTSTKSQLPSVTILFLLSFVFAYILSIVLWGLRYGIHLLYWECWKKNYEVDCETGIKFYGNYTKRKYYLDYCVIKKSNPDAGARITKIKAEVHMTMTFSTGIFVALVGNILIVCINNPNNERLWISIILLLVLIGTEAARIHFRDHMKRSIKNVKDVSKLKRVK